ncbi:copper binding periplasmic CusF family protein [Collimonas arenae]|uniref:Copper binding periplasmic CusF family protein n=1 Tax=Collimonas arenae TaxID=279058 RepID=A0A127QGJ7_9BURK|nr:copper-binding protein [Collimonas arenae]AMO99293.1 copper binding periplasmic CusF family protein [Collimonas arenae]AMP09197.1 copper binding periplasmic CusF family protein [Collimonas arenae]
MKTRSILPATITLALAASFHLPLAAIASEAVAASVEAAAMSVGEVKKIDKEAGKITIKHGPLANLDMPPMTMVFRVSDPAMLNQLQAGDQIKFVAERENGALTVMKMDVVK